MQLSFQFGPGKGGSSVDISNSRCAYCRRRKKSLEFGPFGCKECHDLGTTSHLPVNYGFHHD